MFPLKMVTFHSYVKLSEGIDHQKVWVVYDISWPTPSIEHDHEPRDATDFGETSPKWGLPSGNLTIFNGKIHYFYGHVQFNRYVKLPEATCRM